MSWTRPASRIWKPDFGSLCARAERAAQPGRATTAGHDGGPFPHGRHRDDDEGASSLTGLWACGEVASTGLHGGNRLASNSLLEGLVFGERIARAIRRVNLAPPRGTLEIVRRAPESGFDAGRMKALRGLIGRSLGPLRNGSLLQTGWRRLDDWNPATHAEADRVAVARLLMFAALERRESRGSHLRDDHPQPGTGVPARSFRQRHRTVESLALRRSRVA